MFCFWCLIVSAICLYQWYLGARIANGVMLELVEVKAAAKANSRQTTSLVLYRSRIYHARVICKRLQYGREQDKQ